MKHIVLPTYELHPVNPGGAGVFIAGAARLLARAGIRVTILCDFAEREVIAAQSGLNREVLTPGAVRTVSVERLLAGAPRFKSLETTHHRQKSAGFAEALRRLHRQDPFDVVEFPEYGGAALATLRARASGDFPDVKVGVRLHGGLEFIDLAEGIKPDDDRRLMYEDEASGMELSDFLLTPSDAIGRMYSARYRFDPARLVLSPPPMDVLLDGIDRGDRLPDPAHFLFYGKLQEVKGCDTFAEAGVLLANASPKRRWRFTFVGRDTPCTRHGRPVSKCLEKIIPGEVARDAFEFIPGIDRRRLSRLARTPIAAVVPSRFETFCLAAHELRAVGLPLIVPEIPAFVDWLNTSTGCLTYDGTANGLAAAILRMRDEPGLASALERMAPPSYGAFHAAYQVLLTPVPPSRSEAS